jgi:hypothetical protein
VLYNDLQFLHYVKIEKIKDNIVSILFVFMEIALKKLNMTNHRKPYFYLHKLLRIDIYVVFPFVRYVLTK